MSLFQMLIVHAPARPCTGLYAKARPFAGSLWSSYDEEADTLYVSFKRPAQATESELTDDDVIAFEAICDYNQFAVGLICDDLASAGCDRIKTSVGTKRQAIGPVRIGRKHAHFAIETDFVCLVVWDIVEEDFTRGIRDWSLCEFVPFCDQ